MVAPAEYEWDDAKAASNLAKHNISFQDAIAVFRDPDLVVMDVSRLAEQEARAKAVGMRGALLFAVVYTMRGSACRIISARRANAAEDRAYGNR